MLLLCPELAHLAIPWDWVGSLAQWAFLGGEALPHYGVLVRGLDFSALACWVVSGHICVDNPNLFPRGTGTDCPKDVASAS